MIPIKTVKEFLAEIQNRSYSADEKIEKSVMNIVRDVRKRGDEALMEYCHKFDKSTLTYEMLTIPEDYITSGAHAFSGEMKEVIDEAYNNIYDYHIHQQQPSYFVQRKEAIVGQLVNPIEKVGIYVPGGEGIYPSTLLMNAIPAKIAGVPEIYITTPPNQKGEIDLALLYTAYKCGVKSIYRMGGAHAIAAMAYGTNTVEKVYKITGPGNMYVTVAKKMVYGDVDIDMLAGPSEIMIIADSSSNPEYIVRDLFSQSEHAEDATSILLINSKKQANHINELVEELANKSKRAKILKKALSQNGRIVVYKTIEEAIECANHFAPEHLEILIQMNFPSITSSIKNAGCIFIGEYTPEPVGDYFAGSNHSLPTLGSAKYASPLGVYDFIKRSSIVYYNKEAFNSIRDKVAMFAQYEGFVEHANSIKVRKK